MAQVLQGFNAAVSRSVHGLPVINNKQGETAIMTANARRPSVLTLLAAIALAVALAASAQPAAQQDGSPLSIARQGYFFVGGHYFRSGNDDAMAGQMFVQFQVPAGQAKPYPVVMVHGGNQTGTNFLGTPDGRPGWNEWFLRHGYAVYVVDQPARGRSAYNAALQGPVSTPAAHGAERIFSAPERSGIWAQASLHTQWPGSGQEGDPVFDQFFASQESSITDGDLMDATNRDDLVALLKRIGPAILLTHSRSGPFGWLTADAQPDLVKAILAVEPSGPPFADEPPLAAKETSARPWGIANIPLTFDPPVERAADLAPAVNPTSGGADTDHCWVSTGVKHVLPNLQRMPILIVTAEASHHTRYDECTVDFLAANGVRVDHTELGKIGIHGNGHMMMLEKNNQDVARVLTDWLAAKGL